MKVEVMKPYSPRDVQRSKSRLESIMQDGSDYIAERKLDGCRYLTINSRIVSPRVSSITKKNVDKTNYLPHLHYLLEGKLSNVVLDGEICTGLHYSKAQDVVRVMGCLEGEAIRRQREEGNLHYVVFDILRSPIGLWLYNKPWLFRRKMLNNLKDNIESEFVHLLKPKSKNKQEFLDAELDRGEEGIVLKDISGKYAPGKRPAWNWVKIKSEVDDDVIILGFDPPTKRYTGTNTENWRYWEEGEPVTKNYAKGLIGAIKFGKYTKDGDLIQLGTCSGMTDKQRKKFSESPSEFKGKVAKIQAMEITRDGAYRHPRFVMLHPDKNPEECVIDSKEG